LLIVPKQSETVDYPGDYDEQADTLCRLIVDAVNMVSAKQGGPLAEIIRNAAELAALGPGEKTTARHVAAAANIASAAAALEWEITRRWERDNLGTTEKQ
jgi:ATP-dependent exoDNAse (exonuclease V) alpha subunit